MVCSSVWRRDAQVVERVSKCGETLEKPEGVLLMEGGKDVVIVVDSSGSMSGGRIEMAIAAAKKVVDTLTLPLPLTLPYPYL